MTTKMYEGQHVVVLREILEGDSDYDPNLPKSMIRLADGAIEVAVDNRLLSDERGEGGGEGGGTTGDGGAGGAG